MNERWITYFLFTALGALGLLLALNLAGFGPALVQHEKVRVILPPQKTAQPARPAQAKQPLARRQAALKPPEVAPAVVPSVSSSVSTPAESGIEMNIEEEAEIISTSPPTLPPTAQPAPTPAVQVPAPAPLQQPVINIYGCCQPAQSAPPPVSAQVPKSSARPVGSALQLNIFVNGGWSGGPRRYGYGSTYGWTPGHVARVCEQRSTGTICFDRWIPHPQPGYGY